MTPARPKSSGERPIDTRAFDLLKERGERDGSAVLAAVDREDAPLLISSLVNAGSKVFEARWIKPSLEDVFLTHVSGADSV